MQQVKSDEELRELLDGYLFELKIACGITSPSSNFKYKDVANIVRIICVHFLIYSSKLELDQLKEGLRTLKLLSTMETHASKFLPLFIATDQVFTADALLALFKVKVWSPDGSNDREAEEAVIFNWENYMKVCVALLSF